MLCASQGQWTITSATSTWPNAIRRLSSARARRIWLARARARMCCGAAGAIGAVAFMVQPSPLRVAWLLRRATFLLRFDECAIAMTAEIGLANESRLARYITHPTVSLG